MSEREAEYETIEPSKRTVSCFNKLSCNRVAIQRKLIGKTTVQKAKPGQKGKKVSDMEMETVEVPVYLHICGKPDCMDKRRSHERRERKQAKKGANRPQTSSQQASL